MTEMKPAPLTFADWSAMFSDKTDHKILAEYYTSFVQIDGISEEFNGWDDVLKDQIAQWHVDGIDSRSIASFVRIRNEAYSRFPADNLDKSSIPELKNHLKKSNSEWNSENLNLTNIFAKFQSINPELRRSLLAMNSMGIIFLSMIYDRNLIVEVINRWIENTVSTDFHHFVEVLERWSEFSQYPMDWSVSTLS